MLNKKWPLISLGDILSERTEKPSLEDIYAGKIRIVSKISFDSGQIQLRDESKTKTKMILIKQGDLVLSGINACKGAIAIYGESNAEPIAATIHYSSYLPNKEKVEIEFLWWLLRSQVFRDILNQHLPGGIKTELRAKKFLKIPVPFPPLPEQRRIVTKIEELTVKIKEAKGLRKKTVEEAEALLGVSIEDIFSKSKFIKMTIGDILQDIRYGTSAKASDNMEGAPIIRMGNIQNGQLNLSDLKYLHVSETELLKLRLEYGDIIINRTNSAELVGKCAVFEEEGEYIFASYLIRLRINKNRAIPRLVALYINSPIGREYMFETRKQMTGQANVNSQKIKAMPISLPDINEQQRILTYLERLQSRINNLKCLQLETQSELDALIPSVLAKAFSGKL